MSNEAHYHAIGRSLANAIESQLFGKPCFKVNGKAFISFFDNCMVFKLEGDMHREALSLDGSSLFDPSKKGRPMKEWIQLPGDYRDQWDEFARASLAYVSQQNT